MNEPDYSSQIYKFVFTKDRNIFFEVVRLTIV